MRDFDGFVGKNVNDFGLTADSFRRRKVAALKVGVTVKMIAGLGCAQEPVDGFESLVMEAVDFKDRLAKDCCSACPLFQLDLVHQNSPQVAGVVMIESVRKLVGDVGVQRPAESHVDDLAAAADAEERFAVERGSLDHLPFNGIPRQIHAIDAGMRLAGRKLEGNVSPTGEENAIQARIDSLPSFSTGRLAGGRDRSMPHGASVRARGCIGECLR